MDSIITDAEQNVGNELCLVPFPVLKRVEDGLANTRTGKLTSLEDLHQQATLEDFSDNLVDFDSSKKIIYSHLDVDTEYQGYIIGNAHKKVVKMSLVTVKDWVSGNEYIFQSKDYSQYPYVWDKVLDITTQKYPKSMRNIGKLVINLFYFYALNDVRFLSTHSQFSKDLSKILKKTRVVTTVKDSNFSYTKVPNYYVCDNKTGLLRELCVELHDVSGMLGDGSLASYAERLGIELTTKHNLDSLKSRMNEVWDGKEGLLIKYLMGEYALDDLVSRKFLHTANTRLASEISQELGIDQLVFKATTGSTVATLLGDLISSSMLRHLKEDLPQLPTGCKYTTIHGTEQEVKTLKDLYLMMNKYATSDTIKRTSFGTTPSTLRWLAKVDGGRAKNESPSLLSSLDDYIVDMDFGGAYASVMCSLTLPVGKPCYFHSTEGEIKYSLREVFKRLGDDLVDGLWVMRISSKEGSTIPYQTLLQSQLMPSLEKMYQYESDDVDGTDSNGHEETIKKIQGSLVLFTDELIHASLTSNNWGVIKSVSTPQELKQFLDNTLVESLIWYSKKSQVMSLKEVIESVPDGITELEKSVNSLDNFDGVQSIHTLTNKWYGIPFVDIVMPILKLRDMYGKKGGHKPKNEMYKLFNNTIYGVLASVFFDVGNVVVASNITSKIRTGAWLLHVACNTLQSITDGGAFNVNLVNHRPSRMSLRGLSACHSRMLMNEFFGKNHISRYDPTQAPLVKSDKTGNPIKMTHHKLERDGDYWKVVIFGNDNLDGVMIGSYSVNKEKLDELAWKHTQDFFLGCDIPILFGSSYSKKWAKSYKNPDPDYDLHTHKLIHNNGELTYESKDIYKGIITHGQCDYVLFKCPPVHFRERIGKTETGELITREIDYSSYDESPVFKVRGKELKKDCYTTDGHKYVSIFTKGDITNTEIMIVPKWHKEQPHPIKDYFILVMNALNGDVLVPDFSSTGNYKMVSLKDFQQGRFDGDIFGDEVFVPSRVYPLSSSQYIYRTKSQQEAWYKWEERTQMKTGLKLEAYFSVEPDQNFVKESHVYNVTKGNQVLNDSINRGLLPSNVFDNRYVSKVHELRHKDFSLL